MNENDMTASASVTPIVLTSDNPRDRMKEITDRLEQGIKDIFGSGKYADYLKTLSKFHSYSMNNCLLIAMQKPDATRVAGFAAWRNNFKRNVVKGERGIKIIAPSPYTVKKDMERIDPQSGRAVIGGDGKPVREEIEITVPAFRIATVFDISQTDGEPLPEIGADELTGGVDGYGDFFAALKKASPVPVELGDITGGAKGYYSQSEKRIMVKNGMGELQTLKTAIHETAHARLHDIDRNAPKDTRRPDADTREVEAESVAYTVCQHYGLDTSDYSFGYIATWSGAKELDALKASLDTIRKEAGAIISEVDGHLAELQKGRDIKQELADVAKPTLQEQQPGYGERGKPATAENAPDRPGVPPDDVNAYLPGQLEPGDTFTIYQLKDENINADFRFRSLKDLEAAGFAPNAENYAKVYAAPLAEGVTLEKIFYTFNIERPEDFTGHSLSVSDVVVLDQGGAETAYFVDSLGFKELPDFTERERDNTPGVAEQERENPLKTAEMSTEQNLNMIDGVLNNQPTVAELEARAESGQPISLTDLAGAIKAEKHTAQAEQTDRSADERKPSIREQLQRGKERIAHENQEPQKTAARTDNGLEV